MKREKHKQSAAMSTRKLQRNIYLNKNRNTHTHRARKCSEPYPKPNIQSGKHNEKKTEQLAKSNCARQSNMCEFRSGSLSQKQASRQTKTNRQRQDISQRLATLPSRHTWIQSPVVRKKYHEITAKRSFL